MTAALDVTPTYALDVAAAIGFGIARRALWHEDRCTWFDGVPAMPGANPATSATAGSDVYGGTAGIGLFLAQLSARVDDPTLRRTARGAFAHALARNDATASGALGFYGGRAGVGAAAVLAGDALGDGALTEQGIALLETVPLRSSDPRASDLLGGTAGTLLALLVAHGAQPEAELVARAREAARALIGLARRHESGELSWDTMPEALADLTGFVHGSAGNAYALAALHAIEPTPELRAAVEGAIAYETACFAPEHGNWPDNRWFGSGPRVASYTNAWCHGAVGIVRARLFEEAHGFAVAHDVDAALATIAPFAETLLAVPGFDVTLCHGLFGAIDALLDGVRAGRTAYAPLIARCAAEIAERHHEAERPWPSGLMTREQIDGLLMGTAGIGHVYLRLADPALPSILAPV